MSTGWLAHELSTTASFATDNWLLTWFVGGLNHQIEHHLFPRVCSVHYSTIRPIVREVAKAHGLPYQQQPTIWAAICSHYRLLKALGQPDSSSIARRHGCVGRCSRSGDGELGGRG
jgi:linoleoyl-CoA desaturase